MPKKEIKKTATVAKALAPKKPASKPKAQKKTETLAPKPAARQLRSRAGKPSKAAAKPKSKAKPKAKAAKPKTSKAKVVEDKMEIEEEEIKSMSSSEVEEEEIKSMSSSEEEEKPQPSYSPRVCEYCGSDIAPADEVCACVHLCLVCGHSLPVEREDPANNRYCPQCDSEASHSDSEPEAQEIDPAEIASDPPHTPALAAQEPVEIPSAPVKAPVAPALNKDLKFLPLELPLMEEIPATQPPAPVLPSFDGAEFASHPALQKWTQLAEQAEKAEGL